MATTLANIWNEIHERDRLGHAFYYTRDHRWICRNPNGKFEIGRTPVYWAVRHEDYPYFCRAIDVIDETVDDLPLDSIDDLLSVVDYRAYVSECLDHNTGDQ